MKKEVSGVSWSWSYRVFLPGVPVFCGFLVDSALLRRHCFSRSSRTLVGLVEFLCCSRISRRRDGGGIVCGMVCIVHNIKGIMEEDVRFRIPDSRFDRSRHPFFIQIFGLSTTRLPSPPHLPFPFDSSPSPHKTQSGAAI